MSGLEEKLLRMHKAEIYLNKNKEISYLKTILFWRIFSLVSWIMFFGCMTWGALL